MKKIKCLLISLIMLASSSLFAKDFDWSQCWCNYGAGIKPGTMSIDFAIGINDDFFDTLEVDGAWCIPYLDASFDVALPIWKLPLTWGGFVGTNFGGAKGENYKTSFFFINFGGQIKYHVMLPIEKLDVYAGFRLGVNLAYQRNNVYNVGVSKSWSGSGFYYTSFLGAHYYINDTFGFVLEFGYPVWAKTGVSIKF